MMLWCNM